MTVEGRRQSDKEIPELITAIKLLEQTIKSEITPLLTKHDKTLYGDNDKSLGIDKRVDRLEVAKRASDKHALVAWTAGIGLILKTAWDVVINTIHKG